MSEKSDFDYLCEALSDPCENEIRLFQRRKNFYLVLIRINALDENITIQPFTFSPPDGSPSISAFPNEITNGNWRYSVHKSLKNKSIVNAS